MNIQILLILSLVGFGAARLAQFQLSGVVNGVSNTVNGITGGNANVIDGLASDLNLVLTEKYLKFAERIISIWGKALENAKEKHGIIRAIAMEFIEHYKDLTGEVAREALEFFRPYKDELGDLWYEVVKIVKSIKE
ncbi:hypothetical protein B9Z55_003177 [Caenorhabditis nigoni]|uniref:SXP/RAL-2 family protein Ani s 5-like cation-binding domain-containing protein n=1 Tax=Caenorhabditis nigoni TaxID=1611254 RepID=A0A2G5VPJ5_9PELO|nr:hypothetical protein B9Z55_003177 [Caenorhabditis nigoni]